MRKQLVCVFAAALACGTSSTSSNGSTNPPANPPADAPPTGTPDAGGPVTVPPPPLAKHHLTVNVTGGGQVSTSDGSIACPAVCEADFTDGAPISFSANPATGYDPPSFSGACSGTSCSFAIRQDTQISAVFSRTQVTVSVQITGSGTVASTPAGISCPGRCSASFDYGTDLALVPSPSTGYDPPSFGGACSGKSCNFVVRQDTQISAVFPRTQVTVNVQISGSGTVASTPAGISCPGRCSASFDYGTDVALVPSPSSGYAISALLTKCGAARCDGPLTGDVTYSVTFTRLRMLTIVTGGDGNGRVISTPEGIDCPGKCSASFFEGTLVTLAASPDVNSMVASWGGDCTSAPCSVPLRGDAIARLVWRPRRYIAHDIGPLTNQPSDARAISRDGRYVAGLSGPSDDIYFWHDGATYAGLRGYVMGVNASGTMCGSTSEFHGFTLSTLGVLTDLGADSYAVGINDAGVAVGYHGSRAVYWPPAGNPVDLGAIDGNVSDAAAVNSSGIIVGKSSVGVTGPSGMVVEHAVRWRAPNVIDDLGTLGGSSSDAAAISENGLIVGASSMPGEQTSHGFFIGEQGRMVDVGVPPGMTDSRLTGVNSQGTAVGHAFDATYMYGIVYRAGRLYRLTDLVAPGGLSVWIPTAIAEDGSIAAYGNAADGQPQGLLLTLEPQ